MAQDSGAIAVSPAISTGLKQPISALPTRPQVVRVGGPTVFLAGQTQLPTLAANSGG